MDLQYIRLSNDVLSQTAPGIDSLSTVGMYALLSAFLSNPSFKTPKGGLRHTVARHCSNGRYSLDRQWAILYSAGYLTRTRLPDARGQLNDMYTLFSLPQKDLPAVSHVSLFQGDIFRKSYRSFLPPTENYTPVNYKMLMDARLSLAAKGLYAIIQRTIFLSARMDTVTVCQDTIRRASKLGATAFRTLWKELCKTDYLTVTKVWEKNRRGVQYRYSLLGDLSGTTLSDPMTQAADKKEKLSENKQKSKSENTLTTNTRQATSSPPCPAQKKKNESVKSQKIFAEDRAWVKQWVEFQIEREILLSRGHTPSELDAIVALITDVYLSPKEQIIKINRSPHSAEDVQTVFRQLEAEDIEYVINTLEKAKASSLSGGFPIKNMRSYLLTCLYHAKEEVSLRFAFCLRDV